MNPTHAGDARLLTLPACGGACGKRSERVACVLFARKTSKARLTACVGISVGSDFATAFALIETIVGQCRSRSSTCCLCRRSPRRLC